jgi:integrase
MSDLNTIISNIVNINGTIEVKNLSKASINRLSNLILWDRLSSAGKPILFGGSSFKTSLKETGVIIQTGSQKFDYELKSVMVASLHLGVVEGGNPYKWKSVANRIRTLKRFCSFLQVRDYNSYRELNKLPKLKLRNLISDFLNEPKSKGGMEQSKYTSVAKSARDAFTFLHVYGLVNTELIAPLIDELTTSKISAHEEQHRLKHSIIPTGVMKSLIKSSKNYIKIAKDNLDSFIDIHTRANSSISRSKAVNPRLVLPSGNYKLSRDMSKSYEYIKDLSLHTYTLVLAFTGMRDDEVYALKNNCHSDDTETGEKVFSVQSELSKTSEGIIELDWVANEIVFDAIDILSKVNEVYKERARLMLKHHKHKMSQEQIDRYEKGLEEDRLFGISHRVNTAQFVTTSKSSDSNSSISLKHHSIHLTVNDIEQLEKMHSNYQSVSQQSGKRGLKYKVDDLFNFTAHQFRHTFAWFIIANRLGDLDDIKYQFKHLSRAMTFIYSERGYESLSELRTVIEYFEDLVNKQALEDIIESVKQGKIAGGGGGRLAKLLAKLNSNEPQVIFTTEKQPHFNNTQELIDFATRHSDSIRGLPHGYCTKGAGCKIKNASDPSHCLYCDTYYATPRHLLYWKAIKYSCEKKIERIKTLTNFSRYQSFLTGLEDNLNAANEVIEKLESKSTNQNRSK